MKIRNQLKLKENKTMMKYDYDRLESLVSVYYEGPSIGDEAETLYMVLRGKHWGEHESAKRILECANSLRETANALEALVTVTN